MAGEMAEMSFMLRPGVASICLCRYSCSIFSILAYLLANESSITCEGIFFHFVLSVRGSFIIFFFPCFFAYLGLYEREFWRLLLDDLDEFLRAPNSFCFLGTITLLFIIYIPSYN